MAIRDLQKRKFLKSAAVFGVVGGITAFSKQSFGADNAPKNIASVFNVRDFGAKGDGKNSDTLSIQNALNAAGAVQGTVYFPSGRYLCSKLKLPAHTTMLAEPQWGYGRNAGAILQLESSDADCVVDITASYAGRIAGLSICGLGGGIVKSHGIYLNNDKEYSKREDACVIEDCCVSGFSGDGVYLKRVWLFIVRRNIFKGNGGAGIRVQGWDGFVSDNQLSDNGEGGFIGEHVTATVMFTANRVEWNRACGLDIPSGDAWNITGNCFDRNWGPGLRMCNASDSAVTGNVFRRCGKDASKLGDEYSSQVYLENCKGISVSANSGAAGKDDGGKGTITPKYGFSTKNLQYCAITSNTMFRGFTDKFFNELSQNNECSLKDNIGTSCK